MLNDPQFQLIVRKPGPEQKHVQPEQKHVQPERAREEEEEGRRQQ